VKKLLLTLLCAASLNAEGMENFLSANYNELFDLQLQKSQKDADYDSLSWISPVTLSFERSWSTQVSGSNSPFNTFSVGIDQPIFKSGGIYYAIKYAKSNLRVTSANIIKSKLSLKGSAVELALKIKETKLAIKKLKLQIRNRDIEIKSVQELYRAGLSDSVTLDNALVKKDEAKIALLDMQSNLEALYASFSKISDRNPDTIKIPHLKLPGKEAYLSHNIDLDIAEAKSVLAENLHSVKRSAYLPTVSVGARYTKVSKAQPGSKDAFTNYSVRVSMPLSVNVGNDLERSKLNSMIAKVEAKNSLRDAKADYLLTRKKVAIIQKRINLAKREASAYRRLLKSTRELYRAGQKSSQDVELLENSKRVQQLDIKIYSIEKELAILELYKKVR
jgi:outer membrane protein TolC